LVSTQIFLGLMDVMGRNMLREREGDAGLGVLLTHTEEVVRGIGIVGTQTKKILQGTMSLRLTKKI